MRLSRTYTDTIKINEINNGSRNNNNFLLLISHEQQQQQQQQQRQQHQQGYRTGLGNSSRSEKANKHLRSHEKLKRLHPELSGVRPAVSCH
jgi:hypothetical protein